MRRSIVLSLPLQLAVPGVSNFQMFYSFASAVGEGSFQRGRVHSAEAGQHHAHAHRRRGGRPAGPEVSDRAGQRSAEAERFQRFHHVVHFATR